MQKDITTENMEELKPKIENVEESKLQIENMEELKPEIENVEESKPQIENMEELKSQIENVEESKPQIKNMEEFKLKIENYCSIVTPKNTEDEKCHTETESQPKNNCVLPRNSGPVKESVHNQEALQIVVKCQPDSSSEPASLDQDDNPESIRQSILDLIEDMFHTLICRNIACKRNNCQRLKRFFVHTRNCGGRLGNPPCVPCTHLFMLLMYHANTCQSPAPSLKCTVFRCHKFKMHIRKARLLKQQRSNGPNSENLPSGAVDMLSSVSTSSSLTEPEPSISNSNDDTIIIITDEDTKLT